MEGKSSSCTNRTEGPLPLAIEAMLSIHQLQQWFALSDPAKEKARHTMPVLRELAKLDDASGRPLA